MNNAYEFIGGLTLWAVGRRLWVNHVFSNMVFDHLCDKAVERASASGSLLKDAGAFSVL